MKTINLTKPEESEIKFKISRFPDGQQDIVLAEASGPVTIMSRFNSFLDLEIILATTKALKRMGVKEIHLYIPYLLGARSDRQFQKGGNNYLVDIIAPIINAQGYESVTVVDVHNVAVADACINNLKTIDNSNLVKHAFSLENRECVLIAPDAGASKKIYDVARNLNFTGEIVVASKQRDLLTGIITSTEVPIKISHANNDFIIIDDICDGGRTFIEIAKVIRNATQRNKIYLIVTHGIFSAGLKELSLYFDKIYTTNSVMDINSNTEFGMRNEAYLDKVSQLNVF